MSGEETQTHSNIKVPYVESGSYLLDPRGQTHVMGKQILAVAEIPQWVTGLKFNIPAYKALRRLCRRRRRENGGYEWLCTVFTSEATLKSR